MDDHEHFIRICVRCDCVVGQCACFDVTAKRVQHAVCMACVEKERAGVPEPQTIDARGNGVTLWRDVHQTTQPGDDVDSFELGTLHATLRVQLPVRLVLAWYRVRELFATGRKMTWLID